MPETTTDDLRQFITSSTASVELPEASQQDLSDLAEVSVSEENLQVDRDVLIVIHNLVAAFSDLNPTPTEQQVQKLIDSLGVTSDRLRELVTQEVINVVGWIPAGQPAMSDGNPS